MIRSQINIYTIPLLPVFRDHYSDKGVKSVKFQHEIGNEIPLLAMELLAIFRYLVDEIFCSKNVTLGESALLQRNTIYLGIFGQQKLFLMDFVFVLKT